MGNHGSRGETLASACFLFDYTVCFGGGYLFRLNI